MSTGPPQAITVILTRATNGVEEATTIVMAGRDRFGFDALLDGEYFVTAWEPRGICPRRQDPKALVRRSLNLVGSRFEAPMFPV